MSTVINIPVTDTYLWSTNPNTNYSSANSFYWSYARVLACRADLTALAGKTIEAASFFIRNATTNNVVRWYKIYRILPANSAWEVATATWNEAKTGTPWAGDVGADGGADAGCSVAGTDYVATAMGEYTYPGGYYGGYNEIVLDTTQFTALVAANHGFIGLTDASALLQWYLTEAIGTGYDPYLLVTYTDPLVPPPPTPPTPTPSELVGVGGHLTTPTYQSATTLSIRYYAERLSNAGQTLYIARPSSYSHTIVADGGFETANVTFAANNAMVSDWLENGLMRYIDVLNWRGDYCWQGFVNQINVTDGPLRITLGPVTDIQNKVALLYTPVDTTRVPPGAGLLTTTGWSSDVASQAIYGIWERIENTADKSAAEAARTLAGWLRDNAWPKRQTDFSNQGGGQPQISLDCVGFSAVLASYYYVDATSTGTMNLSAKILDALDTDPNSILSAANSSVAANTLAVPDNDDMQRTADTVIRDLVSIGDAADNRYIWGVYDDRLFVYEAAPSVLDYVAYHHAQNMRVMTTSMVPVDPWDVRPGHWIIYPDAVALAPWPTADFNRDVRCAFIESVTYTAPYTVSISGGQYYKTAQRLARLGLASQ